MLLCIRPSFVSEFSAQRILAGAVAPAFWLGVIACGLVIPFFLELLAGEGMVATLAALLGLFGGLCLRYSVLAGGTLAPMAAAGFEFARVDRPKEPMPAMESTTFIRGLLHVGRECQCLLGNPACALQALQV